MPKEGFRPNGVKAGEDPRRVLNLKLERQDTEVSVDSVFKKRSSRYNYATKKLSKDSKICKRFLS